MRALVLALAAALFVSQWMLWISLSDLEYYRNSAKVWRENYDWCRGMKP